MQGASDPKQGGWDALAVPKPSHLPFCRLPTRDQSVRAGAPLCSILEKRDHFLPLVMSTENSETPNAFAKRQDHTSCPVAQTTHTPRPTDSRD